MENNIENNIKKEFRNREIQPSASAWQRLESKMAVVETTKEKNKYRFIAYAAVFIGLLVSVVLFVQQSNEVKEEQFITKSDKNKVVAPITKEVNEKINEIITKDNELVIVEKSQQQQVDKKKVKRVNKPKLTKTLIAQTTTVETVHKSPISIEKLEEPKYIEEPKTIIAKEKVVKPKKEKRKFITTDDELNGLLATAVNEKLENKTSKDIAIQKEFLLYTIEKENNKKFGNKLIDKVKNGVHAVESYVAHNN